MDPTVKSILFTIAAYLIGSIPMGLIVCHIWAGIDIREYGSGNIGMTNVYRTLKKTHGHLPWLMTFALDFAKGYFPIQFAIRWLSNANDLNPLFSYYIALVVLAVMLGNMFPIYIYFRGGKGIATGFGIFAALIGLYVFIPVGAFLIFFLPSGIVSLGSLAAAVALPITFFLMGENGLGIFNNKNTEIPALSPDVFTVIAIIVAVVIFYKHRGNIVRLFTGKEKRLWSWTKTAKPNAQEAEESEKAGVNPDGE